MFFDSAFSQRFEVLQKASLQRLLLLVKKAEDTKLPKKQKNATDLLQTTSKEIMDLKEVISVAVTKGALPPRYIAKMDHLSETEDELVFLVGDEVTVIQKMTDLCWLGTSLGLVGAMDPRMLLNLTDLGLTEAPQWTKDTTEECFATENQKSQLPNDKLEFYSGEQITLLKKPLPGGLLLGKCQDMIGLVDPKSVKRIPTID